MALTLEKKEPIFFNCVLCDYTSSKQSNYERHLLTRKHKILTNTYTKSEKSAETEFKCKCGKIYKHRQSLYTHHKNCNYNDDNPHSLTSHSLTLNEINEDPLIEKHADVSCNMLELLDKLTEQEGDYKTMLFKLIEENSEIKNLLISQQQQIIDQQRQIGDLIPRIGNNNNTLKQRFNINIFLNEQCEGAINMQDFLNKIDVSLENLDVTRSKGITDGLSNVFIENMNKLPLYKRPLHCTDIKRETLYIKENNIWEKDSDKSRIRAALRDVSTTQYKAMKKWMDINPDYMENPDKQDYFIDMVRHCGRKLDDLDDKIIKRICCSSYIKDAMSDKILLDSNQPSIK
jgi:hypothetical protein